MKYDSKAGKNIKHCSATQLKPIKCVEDAECLSPNKMKNRNCSNKAFLAHAVTR